MKKLIAPLAASLLLASCAGAPGAASDAVGRGGQIPALEAQRYFYGNAHPAPEGGVMKVESAAELSEFFGMATAMGEGGRPTPIDFSKSVAVAVVLPVTDRTTEIRDVEFRETDGALVVSCRVTEGEKRSFSIQPMRLFVLDQKYKNLPVKAHCNRTE